MTWRRLRVIIQHLPPESHTMTALRNAMPAEDFEKQAESGEPERDRWSKQEQILAGIYDRLGDLQYITVVANSDGKGRKPKRPAPLPRPGVTKPKKQQAMSEQAANKLFELINGGAA
ncbi:hypothetical protein [Streptomyces lavendofoliae]|uniref:Uncharacterized protein n=1 Tax=Streptomyces lavendofoliae TaxID=67314 RepID=A0A918I4L1_9ACTN|nr:hypothetical protein [Streptomyces lavendofoliae]GGU62931.1 hypothetical protein GCM10010274_59740 [Streptomyces lavendofoliae]